MTIALIWAYFPQPIHPEQTRADQTRAARPGADMGPNLDLTLTINMFDFKNIKLGTSKL